MPGTFSIDIGKGGDLRLFIPSPNGEEYSVHIPCTLEGVKLLRHVMQKHTKQTKDLFATMGSPTQQMVEQWLLQEGNEIQRLGSPSQIDPTTRKQVERVAETIDVTKLELTL